MKRITIFAATFLFALISIAPLANTALAKKPVIFVSILPQKYFVEQIAGDTVDVEVMVMPGASPATYEPRPRQMVELAQADLYLAIGVPFEKVWLSRIHDTNPKLHIVHIDENLRKLPMATNALEIDAHPHGELLEDYRHEESEAYEAHDHDSHTSHEKHHHNSHAAQEAHMGHSERHDHHEEHDHDSDHKEHEDHKAHEGHHHHAGMLDPHVWLSPRWVKAMLKPTRIALSKVAPEHAKQYRINSREFAAKLDALDQEIETLFSNIPPKKRAFMTFHPSWGYYAMTYNLIQIPIEFEGKAPTPKVLEKITAIAKKRHLHTVFVQPQFARKSAQAIANSIGGTLVVADPLAENWEENMRTVTKKLVVSFNNEK